MQESSDQLRKIELYRQMYTIRQVEESLLTLFSKGLLTGTIHTSIGQEACAVGVIEAINRESDIIWSNHRCHGHFLAYSDDVDGIIAEIMGKSTGICGGIGGSQHLHKNNFYTNGVLGGTVACAAGSAFAEKTKKTGSIVTVFLGDGAMGEGIVYESMNMAALWNLPLLFVLEHNRYAQSTHWQMEHAGNLVDRPAAFGIPTIEIEADDVMVILDTACSAVNRVRQQCKPVFLTLNTYRFAPHSKGDDFRPSEEIESFRSKDPMVLLRNQLIQSDILALEMLEHQVSERVENAIQRAMHAPEPDSENFLKEKSAC